MISGLGYRRMSRQKLCGCDIFTAAAVVGVLQFILIVLALTTSSVLLDKWINSYDDADTAASVAEGVSDIVDQISSGLESLAKNLENLTIADLTNVTLR